MKKISILGILIVLGGCQQYLLRSDAIDPTSGNAITSNSAKQMIDPWQQYVYDTNLETSSNRQSIARAKYENRGELPKDDTAQLNIMPFPYPVAGNTAAPADGSDSGTSQN